MHGLLELERREGILPQGWVPSAKHVMFDYTVGCRLAGGF